MLKEKQKEKKEKATKKKQETLDPVRGGPWHNPHILLSDLKKEEREKMTQEEKNSQKMEE